MSEGMKQQVDTSSAEFKAGLEAGLHSAAEAQNRQAGNDLGPELRVKGETKEPLFISDSPEGHKGNAQDEKDESAE
jgi:hypothetical protein